MLLFFPIFRNVVPVPTAFAFNFYPFEDSHVNATINVIIAYFHIFMHLTAEKHWLWNLHVLQIHDGNSSFAKNKYVVSWVLM